MFCPTPLQSKKPPMSFVLRVMALVLLFHGATYGDRMPVTPTSQ